MAVDNKAPEGYDEFLATPEAANIIPASAANVSGGQQSQEAHREPASGVATPATPPGFDDYIKDELNESKYGSVGQQGVAALEGVAKGVAGPAATFLEHKVLGVPSEDILGRAETHPVTHYLTEGVGLVGSTAAGVGLGSALGKAGLLGSKALGLGAVAAGEEAFAAAKAAGATLEAANAAKTAALAGFSPVAKLGSNVVKHALENVAFQSGDEISKMILKDPGQSSDTMYADIGLAAVIGGSFGTISPLWNATLGRETKGTLKAIADKLGGIEGQVDTDLEKAIKTVGTGSEAGPGLELPPEIKSGLSKHPEIREHFKTLEQSDTTSSGLALQKSLGQFRKDTGDVLVSSLGKSPDELDKIAELSKAEHGRNVGLTLHGEREATMSPLSEAFDNIKTKLKGEELLPELKAPTGEVVPSTVDKIIDKVSQLAINEKWATSPSGDIMKEVNRALKEIPLLKDLGDLSGYITQVGNNTGKDKTNGALLRAGALIKNVLKEAEAEVMATKLGEKEGPAAVEALAKARKEYNIQGVLKDSLDSRLGLGKNISPGRYNKALKEMANTDGETLLRRLSGVNDADALSFLQKNYPKTAEALKNYHVEELLKASYDKAKPDMNINSEVFLRKLNGMSPEMRNFIANPEALSKIKAVESIIDELNKLPHNFSNTARTVDKLSSWGISSAVALIAHATGTGFVGSAIYGALAKGLSKDAPDAIRLGLLKFLGSNQEISAPGFKAAVEYIHSTMRGESLLSRGTKNIFKAGSEVIPPSMFPTDKDRNKIKKAIDTMNEHPDKMLNVSGDVGHYMPEHSTAMTQTAANAVRMLSSLKPNTQPQSPLDTGRKPSSAEKAAYDRAIDIAQQPLIILQHIAQGTLTPQDVDIQRTLYPALYNRTVSKLTDNMTTALGKGEIIPYKVRMGLSLYMGQALDSTMKPQYIMSAQHANNMHPTNQDQQQNGQMAPKRSPSSFSKLPSMYKTTSQSAEEDRGGRRK